MTRSFAVVAALALAYIMPAYSILRRLAGARNDLQLVALRVDGSLSFYGQAAKDAGAALGVPADRPELQTDGSVYLKLPGRCRLEATSAESGKVIAGIDSNGKRRSDLAALELAIAQLCPLMAQRESAEGESRASSSATSARSKSS
jgi:hypothetical protein